MHRLHIASTLVVLVLIFAAGTSITRAAIVDANRGQVKFIAHQSEVPLEGSFNRFSADIDLDPAHPQSGKIRVDIDLASVDAGGADANELLKGADFFDVSHFPSASFVATSVQASGDARFQASGPFTLKGHTANLVIAFVARPDSTGLWFEGSAPVSRLAFNVGQRQWSDTSTLDDDVQIQFRVHVMR